MSALKIFFAVIQKGSPIQISVHRELKTLEEIWRQENREESVGIIHIGFVRPSIKNEDELTKHRGKILTTIAVKWVLPSAYKSSVAVVAELKLTTEVVPLHQLLQGLGCDLAEPSASFKSTAITEGPISKLTVVEAALSILNSSAGPLNAEEIFARIIEQDLYHFGAKKPVSVLAAELNRHTRETSYSNPAVKPLFYKETDGRFSSLEREPVELTGWLKVLADERPELSVLAGSFGIYSEARYKELALSLPVDIRDQLDSYRFFSLANKIDTADLKALLSILPHRVLTSHVGSLELPVRIYNVFRNQRINCLADLSEVSDSVMLKWPNFGQKSLNDLCALLKQTVEKHSDQLVLLGSTNTIREDSDSPEQSDRIDEEYQVELASAIPLKSHFANALADLNDIQRQVIECRTGYNGSVMTLEAVGGVVGVTRERIRQIQKKYVKKISQTSFWDDCIAIKIGQLLIDRTTPLYLEMLEIEDPWFEGFMGNYQHLAAIIELFSENEIRVVNIIGASVVTRIKSDAWVECVGHFRKSLKDKANAGSWTRYDLDTTFRAVLSDNGAPELVPLIWSVFEDAVQFESAADDAKLIAFGISAESAVQAVLSQAEGPLHFTEVAVRATEILGKPVDERRAQGALTSLGAKLFGRGIYGLERFNPICPRTCNNIRLIAEDALYKGPLMKQWHASEIMTLLQSKFPVLPKGLDNYILNIILDGSNRLTYLNRMVWARSDSSQSVNDRIDMADAFTKILEENGAPLKGKEIKERLVAIRGVSQNLQLQPTERMIQIGPDYWGLVDRDVGGTDVENMKKLDILYHELIDRQKGIHVSEVDQFLEVIDGSSDVPSAYALLNLAQRDERFYLGRSMYIALAEWGGEVRRVNTAQAVKEILGLMEAPMTIAEIHALVEDITERPLSGSVAGILVGEGAVYDQEKRLWSRPHS